MKVAIVNPPCADGTVMVKEGRCMQRKEAWGYVMSPLTMVTMATLLAAEGWEVVVLDAVVDAKDVDDALFQLAAQAPDVVIINTSTPSIDDDLRFARLVKERGKGPITTVVYGIHVSVLQEAALLEQQGVDFCVIGEPELTVRELLGALATGAAVTDVPGLAWRQDDRIERSSRRRFIEDLDTLPIPDWSFVDLDNYRLPFGGERFLLINTNRGCPYSCTFCSAHRYYGRKPRRRSVAHIMEEIITDVRRFGVRDFMIWAEEFILDQDFVLTLAEAIIAEQISIRWVCNSRVDAVSPHVLRRIKAAGCWNIAYGIESGVQDILDRAGKGITLRQVREAVAMAKEAGLKVTGHVILGLPGETTRSMAETHRFIKELDLDYLQYYCAMPYPGSKLYEMARSRGWLSSGDWRHYEHNRSVLDYPDLSSEQVMRARTRYFFEYYMQPRVALSLLRAHIRNPGDVIGFVRTLEGFLRWILTGRGRDDHAPR